MKNLFILHIDCASAKEIPEMITEFLRRVFLVHICSHKE